MDPNIQKPVDFVRESCINFERCTLTLQTATVFIHNGPYIEPREITLKYTLSALELHLFYRDIAVSNWALPANGALESDVI